MADFLIDCQDTGSLSAAGAALAACSVIINRCPIPEEPEEPSFEPVALSDGLVPPARGEPLTLRHLSHIAPSLEILASPAATLTMEKSI